MGGAARGQGLRRHHRAALIVFGAMGLVAASLLAGSTPVKADVPDMNTHSWDPGLNATIGQSNTEVHAWGQRHTQGAWGTGPVNYQAGATNSLRANSSGTLNVVLNGTYCPQGSCAYGNGTGYKGLVQFWNDPSDYIAFGVIHDPGVSPDGTTLMIEGAGGGRPVGGYWSDDQLPGTSHLFTFNWTATGVSVTIDNYHSLGPYPVAANDPSISFLAAGRNTRDVADTTFTDIDFSAGSITASPQPNVQYVNFTCSGSAPQGVTIDYGWNNSTTQTSDFPFNVTIPLDETAEYYAVDGQLQGSGSISCSTTVAWNDGQNESVTQTGTASGGYTIAMAEVCSNVSWGWERC